MVTRIGHHRRQHLYIEEWIEHRDLSDEKVANRLGRARETIWRWRTEQHRLNPGKLAELAAALDIEPEEFYRPPSRPSLDAMIKDASAEVQATAVDIVRRLVRKAS